MFEKLMMMLGWRRLEKQPDESTLIKTRGIKGDGEGDEIYIVNEGDAPADENITESLQGKSNGNHARPNRRINRD